MLVSVSNIFHEKGFEIIKGVRHGIAKKTVKFDVKIEIHDKLS